MRAGKANIEVVFNDTRLVIRDVGPWSTHMTVTNDAEGVVSALWDAGLLKRHQRLFYYDSGGELDELLHNEGSFTGFKPGPAGAPWGDLT